MRNEEENKKQEIRNEEKKTLATDFNPSPTSLIS